MNPSVLEYHRLTESLLIRYEQSNNNTAERKNIETQLTIVENSYSFLFNEYNLQTTYRQLLQLRHGITSQIPPTQLNTVNNKRKPSEAKEKEERGVSKACKA